MVIINHKKLKCELINLRSTLGLTLPIRPSKQLIIKLSKVTFIRGSFQEEGKLEFIHGWYLELLVFAWELLRSLLTSWWKISFCGNGK